MRKFVVGAVAAASLVGGSVAVAALNPLGLASAQDPPTTQAAPPSTAAPAPGPSTDPATGPGVDKGHGPRGDHGGKRPEILTETLQELVANGTITQAQADAITEALKAKFEQGHPRGPGEGGPGGSGFRGMEQMAQTVADAIGIDVETLKTELQSGKSIAEVAQAHGVDPQKVIDALVAKATAHIDEGVAAGKIPAEKADKLKAELPDHIAKMVNGKMGDHKGHHGPR